MQQPGWQHLVFPGDGEMVRQMRDYPWEGSGLGDPRDWPASLRTACRICLTSRFPMIVWWGPDLRIVYNDAYLPLLGDKHPALGLEGRQVWGEIWDTIGPMLDSVLRTGQATWSEDMLLPMRRHGYREETYWTYSYSPLHDDVGTVRGVFTAVAETTEQVVGQRRLAVLQELGAQAGRGRRVAEVCDLVVQTLTRAGQVVPYAAIYLCPLERDGDVTDGGAELAASSAAGPVPSWPVDEVLRSGRPARLTDVAERFARLPASGWPDPPAEAMVLPLQADGTGGSVGVIVLAASAGRALDEAYQDFLGLVARHVSALVNAAIAYQAQLRRAEELAELDRAIEGLDAGADDYLVKPFSAAELVARVRTSVALSRMRGQHARWRAALIESLHEAFFLCGQDGTVLEINSAFADMLGYGPDGLPYPPPHPWWPDQEADPDGRRMAEDILRSIREQRGGSFTVPLAHRDGRRLWVAGSFNEITDQKDGRLAVGTFRDVTAEHYASQRESALAALGQVLASAQNVADTLREALGELHRLWRASRAVAAIWTDAAEPSVTASVAGVSWHTLPAAVRAALTGLRERPPLTPVGVDGGAGVCLEHPAGTLTIWIELPRGRTLTTEDQTLLSLVAGRLGQALHRAHQNDEQRETALALQRAILGPLQLPAGFSARYEPATRPLEVGGDWHDIIELPDGRIAIVVGDCVGHDLGAATVMGQLRSACRALLLQDASPGRVLAAMDRFAASVPGAEGTTVCCAVLDSATGRLTYSSAGHPPGIVAQPDGDIVVLDGARSFPLAVGPYADRREAGYVLQPQSTLLLYTDGLVERRGRPLTDGMAEAGAAVTDGTEDSLEDLATRIMARLAPPAGYGDDVAIVLYRHPAPLELAFPADTGQLAPARARLRRWLDSCAPGTRIGQDALVAAGEAVANAIEHGHRDNPGGEIRLRAATTAGRLWLTVIDSGSWLPPGPAPAQYRGKGVMLMRALMDNVNIEAGPAGTTVTMDARITP